MPAKFRLLILLILAITVLSVFLNYLCSSYPFLDIGQLIILAITLVFIIAYVWDTHRIANATEEKWEQELKPKLQYGIILDPNDPQRNRVLFRLINTTDYMIEAKVNCNFKIYGEPVAFPGAYGGTETWDIFPHQMSQGHFSINAVLDKKGKNRDQMIEERSGTNANQQLTMDLEITFKNEVGRSGAYPSRRHNFDFERLVWIPELTRPD